MFKINIIFIRNKTTFLNYNHNTQKKTLLLARNLEKALRLRENSNVRNFIMSR